MRFSFKKLYFERLLFSGIKVSSGFIFVLVLTFNFLLFQLKISCVLSAKLAQQLSFPTFSFVQLAASARAN